jgi:hypothetical protein
VPESELYGHRGHPRRDPGGFPEPPRRDDNEQERDDDLPGQGHDLSDSGAGRMELRVKKGHDRLQETRRPGRSPRERHRVIDGPLVEARQRSRGDESDERRERSDGR